MFKKILIANRGEIAVRVIRACHEWASRRLRSIPTWTAHRCTCARRTRPIPSARRRRPSPISISRKFSMWQAQSGADAIHPGYGFLSENAQLCARLRGRRHEVHRAHGRCHGDDGLENAGAAGAWKKPGCHSCPALRAVSSHSRRREEIAERDWLSGDAESRGGRRRQRHAAGASRREELKLGARRRAQRGRARVRRRRSLHRKSDRQSAAHRDAGSGR